MKIMEFLHIQIERKTVVERVEKGFSVFHRTSGSHVDPYTQEQRKYLQNMLRHVYNELREARANVLAPYVHMYMMDNSAMNLKSKWHMT